MSDSLLSKRLDRALNAAQYLTQVFPDFADPANSNEGGEVVKMGAIDITKLATWTEKDLGTSLRRQSLKEGFGLDVIEREERERTTGKSGPAPGLDPFYILRGLVIALGEGFEKGVKEVAIEDAESGHAIFIKVVDVRKVNDKTPLLVVQFRLDAKSLRGPYKYTFWKLASTNKLALLRCNTRSLMLLHRLLSLNSDRVPSSEYRSADLKATFILPVGPIEKTEIARLTRDFACALHPTAAANWATHKKTCNNLTTATWSTMTFGTISRDLPVLKNKGLYSVTRSMDGGSQKFGAKLLQKGEVPPNEHGDNPFLIKVQYNGSAQMMVYDRTRALETLFDRKDNPRVYDQIVALVKEKGFMGQKIYVWAKRTADYELSLALDKIPGQNVPW
ncbi:hypothetical protein FRC01_000546 [Tulasnella sp. 417]|nr:hypothetical protein FRC01_000546 [Tulasnella sp. 417]